MIFFVVVAGLGFRLQSDPCPPRISLQRVEGLDIVGLRWQPDGLYPARSSVTS